MPKPYPPKGRRLRVRELVARTTFPAPTKEAVEHKLALLEQNMEGLKKLCGLIKPASSAEQTTLHHDLGHFVLVSELAVERARCELASTTPNMEKADRYINYVLRELEFSKGIASRGKGPLRRISAQVLAKELAEYPSILAEYSRLTGDKPKFTASMYVMPAALNANSGWLRSVVFNLCQNALRAVDEEGRLHMDLCTDSKNFIITVSNTGKILSDRGKKSFLEAKGFTTKEFDPAQQHGLGQVSIMHALKIHNGALEIRDNIIDNKPSGTVFIVKIPLAK
ncbi:MAG: ATP-binding protein [Candidatus Diapherotrites archaeon]